jgi:hypothetical protein
LALPRALERLGGPHELGEVEHGEDGLAAAAGLPGWPIENGRACYGLWSAFDRKFSTRAKSMFKQAALVPAPATLPDGSQVVLEGRWTFFVGSDGKPQVVSRLSRLTNDPAKLQVSPAQALVFGKAPRGAPKGAFAVTIDGKQWTVSIKRTQEFRVLADGRFGTRADEMPASVDSRSFIVEFSAADGESVLLSRCD